jgi:hypothetical protein
MLWVPPVKSVVTHSRAAGNVTGAHPGTTGPPTPSVKVTVPRLGCGPAAPDTVAVNVTGVPNPAGVGGLADTVTVGAASAIEYGKTALSALV